MTQRLGTDLNIGPTFYATSSHLFNGDYPRKEIKALSAIELMSLRNGLEADVRLISDNRCFWNTTKISVLNLKRF